MTATTDKTASNGSKRLTGMTRVREAETWRIASVMHDAAFEAERLCEQVYRAISDAYQPSQGDSTAAATAASPDIRARAQEARLCLYAAAGHLTALIGDGEPPS
jgi:ferric-dicitrate binding protein FerR (iron transport regulator)